ncbi:MAG: cell division protein ZapA [Bryobacteraceae bacterium]|nr:cell division protein ZapA [Bryobacteraceae bacterium]
MDGSEKQPVRLNIFNQSFTLRVPGDPDEILRAANEVDELMSTIAKSGNMDSFRIAILACLHLQDRVHVLEGELRELRSAVNSRTSQLAQLLDGLEPDSKSGS